MPPKSSARIHPTDHTSTVDGVSLGRTRLEHEQARLTGFGVFGEAEHDLRSTVPSRGDILCLRTNLAGLVGIGSDSSCQTEIANLQFTVGIHKQIARLQIAMENVGRVDVFETAENLVDEGLEVCVGQRLARSVFICQDLSVVDSSVVFRLYLMIAARSHSMSSSYRYTSL